MRAKARFKIETDEDILNPELPRTGSIYYKGELFGEMGRLNEERILEVCSECSLYVLSCIRHGTPPEVESLVELHVNAINYLANNMQVDFKGYPRGYYEYRPN